MLTLGPDDLFKQLESEDVDDGGHPVFPADFLAFAVVPPRIRNGNLINPAFKLRKLEGNLGFETEPF